MRRLLTAFLLLFAAAAPAQRVDTALVAGDLMLAPGTFLLRSEPVIAVYQGWSTSGERGSGRWNRQRFPSHDSILRAYRSWGYEPLRIRDLSTASPAALLRGLGTGALEIPGTGYVLNIINEEDALVRLYGSGEPPTGEPRMAMVVAIELLSINGGHKLIEIAGFGSFLPVGGRFVLYHNGRPTDYSTRPETDPDAVRRLARLYNPGGLPFQQRGRWGLRSVSGRTLIAPQYDSVTYITNALLAGHRGPGIDLYYPTGERLPLDSVRAARLDTETGSVSIARGSTRTHWLDRYGNITPSPALAGYCGTGSYHRISRIVPERDTIWLEANGVRSLLAADPAIDSIRFLSGQTVYEDFGRAAGFEWRAHPYFVRYRDGRSGIAEFDNGQPRFQLPPGHYRFRDIGSRMRFEEAGTGIGLYPLHPAPRYRSLGEFDKGFARYTLPDGSSGWVDYDGKEYPDRERD